MNEQHNYSEQIRKLSPMPGDLMVMNVSNALTPIQRERITEALGPLAKKLGCQLMLLEPGMTLSLQIDPVAVMAEQKKQTALLEQLVEQQSALLDAMADDVRADEEDRQTTYLDGSPMNEAS
ncbi:hypothetical protein [Pseudomonas abietaniphila]